MPLVVGVREGVVVPGGDAPEGWICVQEGGGGLEVEEEVGTEEHVVFYDDNMTV